MFNTLAINFRLAAEQYRKVPDGDGLSQLYVEEFIMPFLQLAAQCGPLNMFEGINEKAGRWDDFLGPEFVDLFLGKVMWSPSRFVPGLIAPVIGLPTTNITSPECAIFARQCEYIALLCDAFEAIVSDLQGKARLLFLFNLLCRQNWITEHELMKHLEFEIQFATLHTYLKLVNDTTIEHGIDIESPHGKKQFRLQPISDRFVGKY